MATEISCINKTTRFDAHDRIHTVGGSENGIRWKRSESMVIADIEGKKKSYFVNKGGSSVPVIVAERLGKKYLKTVGDGEHPNNLLSLPECP